jgi:hypothetical protein
VFAFFVVRELSSSFIQISVAIIHWHVTRSHKNRALRYELPDCRLLCITFFMLRLFSTSLLCFVCQFITLELLSLYQLQIIFPAAQFAHPPAAVAVAPSSLQFLSAFT